MEVFARADGFEDLGDMARFWIDTHAPRGATGVEFEGVMIDWG
jgi:hypothetical protein